MARNKKTKNPPKIKTGMKMGDALYILNVFMGPVADEDGFDELPVDVQEALRVVYQYASSEYYKPEDCGIVS